MSQARAVEELHSQLRHRAMVLRDGTPATVDVTTLVPGEVVRVSVGDVVPADVRLSSVNALQCDESVLTGESLPVRKQADPRTAPRVVAGPAVLRVHGHGRAGRERAGGGRRERVHTEFGAP